MAVEDDLIPLAINSPSDDLSDPVESRLFAIECSLSRIEQAWQSVDATHLLQVTRTVEQNCNDVIALSAALDRSQQDEALHSMFIARVTSGIAATVTECTAVRRALHQLEQSLPPKVNQGKYSERITALQHRMLTQLEAAESNDDKINQLQGDTRLLACPLQQLHRLRQMTDTAEQQATALLAQAQQLGLRKQLQLSRAEWAAHSSNIQLLLNLNNSCQGKLELGDPEQLSRVLAAAAEEAKQLHASDGPDPELISALKALAVETRSEGDRQQAVALQLLKAAGAASAYEPSSLEQLIEAVTEQITESGQKAALLEQHLTGGAADDDLAVDSVEAARFCADARQQINGAVAQMEQQAVRQRSAIDETWAQINAARELAGGSCAAVGRVQQARNAISEARQLASKRPQ